MSSSFSAQERANALEEARVAEELREFWQQPPGIRPNAIWSNIESAIQLDESRRRLSLLNALKQLFISNRAQYASMAIALVLTILGGSLLYSRTFEGAEESFGGTGFTQASSVNAQMTRQTGIPGYTDAIVDYREGLSQSDPAVIAGHLDAVEVPVIGQSLTPAGIGGAVAEIANTQFDSVDIEQVIASAGMTRREQDDPISSTVENTETTFGAYEIELGFGGRSDISRGDTTTGALPSPTENGLSETSGESSTPGGGGPSSTDGVGAVAEPDGTTASDPVDDDSVEADDPVDDDGSSIGEEPVIENGEEPVIENDEPEQDRSSENIDKDSGKSKKNDQDRDSGNSDKKSDPPELETGDEFEVDGPVAEDDPTVDEEPVAESGEPEQDNTPGNGDKSSGKSKNDGVSNGHGAKSTSPGAEPGKKGNAGGRSDDTDGVGKGGSLD